MSTKLAGELHREFSSLSEFKNPLVVTLREDGIELRVKGARKRLYLNWWMLIRAAQTPTDVPAWLYGKPYEMLQAQDRAKTKGLNE